MELDDLAAILDKGNAPISATQRINIAYIQIQKYLIYKSALNRWDEKVLEEKMSVSFKEYFWEANKALNHNGYFTPTETINSDQVMDIVS